MESNSALINDEYYLNEAIKEAQKALHLDEVPIGCVIVDKTNTIIGRGHNTKETDHDCTSHAEIHAIQSASKHINDWRLNNCIIYTTLEPCLMCAGAILHARLDRIVCGAMDSKWGAETIYNLFTRSQVNHQLQFDYHENTQCKTIIQTFFKNKRKQT